MSFLENIFFLSNFYITRISFNGEIYSSVEHAFQAEKTENRSFKNRIKLANTPAEAKKIGRQSPLRHGWKKMRVVIMKDLLFEKFKYKELLIKLHDCSTGIITEGNTWHDNFWGICKCSNCNGGKNVLGKLLMHVRKKTSFEYISLFISEKEGF
jgi:ribA/ribD-fused uncharacterized protein